ncbi:hypothetical protein EV182_005009 [Spiromyces aspiralis]|uniref:Uncharacterized protein n=1 Tax=Spiromyces aspiralis TaxID=68401 RepID=A0ACC1HAU3_9FUNG|nr:hypothetical protein EV182_005009 [Spiromyces aspiralis]
MATVRPARRGLISVRSCLERPRPAGARTYASCTLGRAQKDLDCLPPVGYVYLGNVAYDKATRLQTELVSRRIEQVRGGGAGISRLIDVLLLLEHPPVYTNGRRNKGKLSDEEIWRVRAAGADYVETNRGGEITFHGPGQLVGYPIMHIKAHHLAARCYVEGLENTIIDVCRKLGLPAFRTPEFPGVWTSPDRKVAAIGSHIRRYITSHGFGLNCTTDLAWFTHIVPCGLEGKYATSLQTELERHNNHKGADFSSVGVEAVVPLLVESFGSVFNVKMEPLATLSPATLEFIQDRLQ